MQVHWLTLGATMAAPSAMLFKQLPLNSTVAYQLNLTVQTLPSP